MNIGPEDNGSELRCEATNSAVTKPVSETITIELLPESTTAKQEYETKTSEAEHVDYDYDHNDDYYTYDSMNDIDSPYKHPNIQTNILTGAISKSFLYSQVKNKYFFYTFVYVNKYF